MKIGIPKEIKTNENRVAMTPAGVNMLVVNGHEVYVENGAGVGSSFFDQQYAEAGAKLVSQLEVWSSAELIVKVKEPIESEWSLMRPEHTIFTYFHFAANSTLTRACLDSGANCIAYETVQLQSGELPLLTPMSEIAGRMSIQAGAKCLERAAGGLGILLGGVPGVLPAKVVILGGGVVGSNAAKIAAGMGAEVIILDTSLTRLRFLAEVMPSNVKTLFSNRSNILEQIKSADLVIGGVLIPGAEAPKLIKMEDLLIMKRGSVIVDVAVDQGGCVETTHPTTHQDPTYEVYGVVHYAVANMPGGVPLTATVALTNATLPYVLELANLGIEEACRSNQAIMNGLNIHNGYIFNDGVSKSMNNKEIYQTPTNMLSLGDAEIIHAALPKINSSLVFDHTELKAAWLNGMHIQFNDPDIGWINIENPMWMDDCEYRIKPSINVLLSEAEKSKYK